MKWCPHARILPHARRGGIAGFLMTSTACATLAHAAPATGAGQHRPTTTTHAVHAPVHHAAPQLPETIHVSRTRQQAYHSQPGTVNVISGAELRQLRLESPKDIAAFVPGVTAVNATSGSTPIFSIRGVGLDDYSGTNMGGIGIYLDGVFAPYPEFYSGQMLDVQNIAVEKGPQGFDYGRSTTGGSMNVESVKPDNKFGGYADWGYSSYNTNTGKFAVNVPITDRIFNRTAFSYTKGDGWQHDIHTNERYGAQDILAVRNLTKFVIDDKSSLLLNLHYTRNRGTPSSPQDTNADSMYGTPTGAIGVGPNASANAVNVGNQDVRRQEDGGGVSVTYNRDFSFGQFVSTTAIDFYRRNIIDNYDGESLHIGDNNWQDQSIAQMHDMHLRTNIAKRLHLTVGVYESYDKIKGTYSDQEDVDFAAAGVSPFDAPPATFAQHFTQQNVSTGVYVNTVTNVIKNLDFIASGRFSYDDRAYRGGTTDETGSLIGAGQNISYINEDHSYERYTGRVGLRYRIRPGTFVYGTISNGYKAGSYFSAASTAPQSLGYVRPENLIAYEVGIKASLLHNRLQLEGALFDYEYHNRQTLVLAQMPKTTALTLGSIPRARTRGGEISGTWHNAIPNLDLRGSFAYLDAKIIDSVDNVRGLSLYQSIPSGSALPFSPRFSWDAVARYNINMDRYRMTLQASYSWKDNMLVALSDPNAKISKISSLGLRMTFGPKTEKWSASVYVENLTNNHGDTYSFTGNDNSRAQYIQTPRWVGCELHYKFGK